MSTVAAPALPAGRFTLLDWGLLAAAGGMWGASFLLIKEAVADFSPATVAWLRLLLGAAALACFPAARRPLARRADWLMVAVLGLVWMAVPFVLFPLAEQTVDSALAGMVNGAAPLFTALVAVVWFRHRLAGSAVVGLLVGFVGVLAISIPSAQGRTSVVGVLLLIAAVAMYGIAFNVAEPLQRRSGALPVVLRAQVVAMLLTMPFGAVGLTAATPTMRGTVALIVLGVVSTGLAFACFTTLISRVGAPRASVSVYLAPCIAIVLGATVGGEHISPIALGGIVFILVGAYLTSRRGSPR